MVVVPAGSFMMGAEPWPKAELSWDARIRREVTIAKPFAVGKFEITYAQYDACVADGGCARRPDDFGWGRVDKPVLDVSWREAQDYTRWLSRRTGGAYRLLTEAEWEYAARGGTRTPYPWGHRASHEHANYGKAECCHGRALGKDRWIETSPVGSFAPNPFGLHDMHGNVYEWTEDCFVPSYEGAPTDGSAVRTAACDKHPIRGAAYYSDPGRIRSAYRAWQTTDNRGDVIGFRVAKTLN
jgi:formylglycine-generating enzyme required for sulfatase activity